MINRRHDRLKKLSDMDHTFQSAIQNLEDYGSDLIKMITNNNSKPDKTQTIPSLLPTTQSNISDAIAYNTKNESYFKNYEQDIKRILNTSADWKSEEFANTVRDWQEKNGFTGKWIDGKFGMATMHKLVQQDPALAKSYDVYAPWKIRHINDKPYNRVINLTGEVDRIRKEMGATDIPLNMLMGWIQVESGGNINSRGLESLDERGLFQVSRDEAKAIGADHDKISTDQDYSIRAGINLARYHANRIDQILSKYPNMSKVFVKGTELYWKLVLFSFSAGAGTADALVNRMASSGEQFSSWDDVMKFAAANPSGFKHSPIKWSYHVNRAFNLGNQISGISPTGPVAFQSAVAFSTYSRIKNAKRIARMLVLKKINAGPE